MAGNNATLAEINKIEIKRTIQRINEMKSWFFEKIYNIPNFLSKNLIAVSLQLAYILPRPMLNQALLGTCKKARRHTKFLGQNEHGKKNLARVLTYYEKMQCRFLDEFPIILSRTPAKCLR